MGKTGIIFPPNILCYSNTFQHNVFGDLAHEEATSLLFEKSITYICIVGRRN